MRANNLRKRISSALDRTREEMRDSASHGGPARGLANEGYAGGFAQALMDIQLLLNNIEPSDTRGYWKV